MPSRTVYARSIATIPFGNLIEYLYERDTEQIEGPHQWDQLYLSGIRYADYGDRATPRFLVTVAFTYENMPDPFSEYRAGFEIRTIKRCKHIEIFTHPETDILVRTYHLQYLDERGLSSDRLPPNGINLLTRLSGIQLFASTKEQGERYWRSQRSSGFPM